ncbi:MAG: protein kinase [Deltaproteobacteria bacterium]|nr:protein kinase [Deltaproteobacteria bacterium]
MSGDQPFPQPFGPYVLERFVASGGMAEVFLARRTDGALPPELRLCVKRILTEVQKQPEYVTMFKDEAALSMRLIHPNIVRVFDFGDVGGRLYMAMEYVDGMDIGTLQRKLRVKSEALSVQHALQIGVDICAGLAHAHTLVDEQRRPLKLIHRDVSPQNIMISAKGEVKLTDFGIAKAVGRETHTATGMIKGKVQYMAPEQALGQHIDQRIDQFAAGIVVWEMVTGQRLFADKSELLVFEKIIRQSTPKASSVRPEVPAVVDQVIARALAKSPDERYPDMRAFGAALSAALAQTSSQAFGGAGGRRVDLAAMVSYVMGQGPAPAAVAPPPEATTSRSTVNLAATPSPRPATGPARLPTSSMTPLPVPSAATRSSSGMTVSAPDPGASWGTPGTGSNGAAGVEPLRPRSNPASQVMAPAAPRGLPVGALAATLVLGLVAGFAAAKLIGKPDVAAQAGCGAINLEAMVIANDELQSAQDAINAGDFARAESLALRSNSRSASPKGHYLLGQLAMRVGDTGRALEHYRCVTVLAPDGEDAGKLRAALQGR